MNYLMTRNDNDFETLFNNMFGNWGIKNSNIPSVDVFEDEKAYYVEAELAGYNEEDVNVHIEKHVLHISSEKSTSKEGKKFIIRERSFMKFDRSFSLPESVDESGISAEFKNGVLTVTLPKKPIEKPKRIEVKISK